MRQTPLSPAERFFPAGPANSDSERCVEQNMTREAIEAKSGGFLQEFEIEDPAMDADLREAYQFDSIDAIELLVEIERFWAPS